MAKQDQDLQDQEQPLVEATMLPDTSIPMQGAETPEAPEISDSMAMAGMPQQQKGMVDSGLSKPKAPELSAVTSGMVPKDMTSVVPTASPALPQSALGDKLAPGAMINPQTLAMAHKQGANVAAIGKQLYEEDKPQVTASPTEHSGLDYYDQKRKQMEYEDQHPYGSMVSEHPSMLGKILHGLSMVGNIAGDIVAPGTMQLIPGTMLNRKLRESNLDNRIAAATQQEQEANKQDLVTDAQGNVVGWKQGGQVHDLKNAPQEIQDLAAASHPKGGWSMKTFNITGPDGKPMSKDVGWNESVASKLMGTPEFAAAPNKMKFLEDNGALVSLDIGQTAPSGANSRPQYKMVPVGNGEEQLALMNPDDPTHPTMIGQPTRIGSTSLVTFESPDHPGEVQFAQRDNKTGAITAIQNPAPGMVPTSVAGKVQELNQHFDTEYVKPAMDIEKSFEMMDQAYKDYQDARAKGQDLPTGAESMLALSTHLQTTFGGVKGARITKDMINEHKEARGLPDNIKVMIQKIANGDQLSPDQWKAFRDLVGQSRQATWRNVLEDAVRQHVHVDPVWIQRAGVPKVKNPETGQRAFELNGRRYDVNTGEEIK